MGVDAFDIVAIILGVHATIRKLDAQRRTHKEFSHVEVAQFESWREREVAVFSTVMAACFSKVFADWGFVFFLADSLPASTVRVVGATIDISWAVLMVVTLFQRKNLAVLRQKLGMTLGGFVAPSGKELSTELKGALRRLEDGELERAAYELKQISLDNDETMKGLALYWLGECLLRQGKHEEARGAFLESIDLDPTLNEPQDALERLDAKRATSASP